MSVTRYLKIKRLNEVKFLVLIDVCISFIFFIPDLPSKPDKVAIVTGGSRGIGAEVVKKLLQCDMEVIIGELFTKLLSL